MMLAVVQPATLPVVLTIAGSDSGGGAGIQADLKTFEAHGVFGTSVVTALTAQNTRGVTAVFDVPLHMVADQLAAVFDDFDIGAIKIGMLSNPAIVSLVAERLQKQTVPIVLDPVMVATSGDLLLQPEAVRTIQEQLMPLATVVTPNAHEAAVLLGRQPSALHTTADAETAAHALQAFCPNGYVLVKGSHLQNTAPAGAVQNTPRLVQDVLVRGNEVWRYELPYLETTRTHGTGCTLSSAIAANLALGLKVHAAVERAKRYVHEAIRRAPAGVGHGHGPLLHHIPLPA